MSLRIFTLLLAFFTWNANAVRKGSEVTVPIPYLVSIQEPVVESYWQLIRLKVSGPEEPEEYIHKCGGSIISEKHILTAAHCVLSHPKYLSVVVGVTDWLNVPNGQRYLVDSVKIHEKYDRAITTPTGKVDVAVVVLRTALNLTNPAIAQIINMSPEYDMSSSTDVKIAGWSKESKNDERPFPRLKEAQMVAIGNETCVKYYVRDVNDYEMCLIDWFFVKSIFRGDSGSPVTIDIGGKPVVVGIVKSYTSDSPFKPAIAERISSRYDWIVNAMNDTIRKI